MAEGKQSRGAAMVQSARRQGGTIATSLAIVATWLINTYSGINPPPEVVSAMSALIGSVGTYVQTHVL